jgi:hypothetical protein
VAVLRPVEERDSKGNTTRINASITFKQDQQIRRIRGRHDYDYIDNPDYHPPITAQVQNGKILFFLGVPDSTPTRAAAKELKIADVPEYIVRELKNRPMKVREARPTVYEVKLATMAGIEVTEINELANDGMAVVIEPIAPNLGPKPTPEQAEALAEASL